MSCRGKRSARVALETLLLCIAFVSALATTGNDKGSTPFSDDTAGLYQRVSQMTPPAGADVLFVENQETLVFDADGQVTHLRYFLYKVLTQKGAEGWADISLSWEPWREERPTLRARVITPDKDVHLLDEKTVTDSPATENQDNVFSDRRVVRAPLPAVVPGSLVEEEQTSKESAPFIGAASVERFYFAGSVRIEHTRLALDAPSTLPIRYETRLLSDLKPERTESEGRIHIIFDHGPTDAIESVESELPSDLPAYPSVTFSTGNSWQAVGEEYGKLVDQQVSDVDLKSLVANLVAGKKSRDEKASAILQYLDREIRYTGVEFGAAAVVPRSPKETLARRYGDCKDKAALLVAMLRTANISAYIALLNATNREDVAPDLPGMGMFDHAIVYVPGPDLWVDATDQYARLGELPIADQERFALIAGPDSNSLVRTPATSSASNLLVEKREIYLAENGPARIIETSQPHGSSESFYRRSYADKENKQEKDKLTDYVKNQYLAEKLDRIDRSDPNDLSRQFELVLECDRARRGSTDLDSAAAAIRFEGLFSRLPEDLRQREKEEDSTADKDSRPGPKKKRTSDYQLPEAFVTEWRYTIVPPLGFRPKPLPQNAKLSLGPSILTEEFAADKDGIVSAVLRFDTVKRRLTVSEATALRNEVAQLLEGEPILIYFEPVGQALLSQGKVKEALQSYRDLVALYPKEAVHHLRLAETFLSAGLGEAARSEARDAFKLEPGSALAAKTLAEILEYDLVGRKFRPGSDYAGAEAAFRAAEDLDPEDKATVANLAVLLEYNRWGLRYGPGARLKDALTEYRKLSSEKLAAFGMRQNLAYVLFYDGQFSEAEKSAETLNPPPLALIVACEAALNGSQAALNEAKKRTGNEEQFRTTAKNAGDMIVELRKYSLAANLLEAGASGDDASETEAFASLYRKTVPREQLQFPDDPVGVALRYHQLRLDPVLTVEQLRSVCSRNGKTTIAVPDVLEVLLDSTKALSSRKAREGKFVDDGFDLSFARAQQPNVQGNDAMGYKVTLWPSAKYKLAVYVVKEDGHYKVLAVGQSGAPQARAALGLEALDRIAARDLDGARALFDWLRDDIHLEGGDDPLSGTSFPRFWTRGRDADAVEMKLVAASILMQSKQTVAQGVAILEAATGSKSSDLEKVNVALALLEGYTLLDASDKALAISERLAKQYPESKWMFFNEISDLRLLRRFEDADRLAEARLKRIPGDTDGMRAMVYNAAAREDYAKARTLSQRIRDEGKAEPRDLNGIAWYSLFTGKVEDSDVEDALKGAQLSERAPGILHTLGCVYVAVGKTKEAREVLLQAMDSLDLDEPDSNYLFAFGLIAEQYGERDLARAEYARVVKPERAYWVPSSVYALAQIHLQALRIEKQ